MKKLFRSNSTTTSFVRRSGNSRVNATHSDEDVSERDSETDRQPKPQFHSECFRKMELMIEFTNLRNPRHCPSGIYVMPAADNFHTWFGVIFVHKGYYKNAVFKFKIQIPNEYPEKIPTVQFINADDIFHPLIDSNGNLSLVQQFKDWTPHKHYIFHILHYIKKAFKKDVLNNLVEKHCPNKTAFNKYHKEIHTFAKLAKQCADLSISETKLYENHIEANPIRFPKLEGESLKEKLEELEELKKMYLIPAATPEKAERPPFASRRTYSSGSIL